MADFDLSLEIEQTLNEYLEQTDSDVKNVLKEKAKELASDIKDASPNKTGIYAKGWTYKDNSTSQFTPSYIVYNKGKQASLSHLLENGHLNRDGSRTKAIPHITPATDKIQDELTKAIEEVLGK